MAAGFAVSSAFAVTAPAISSASIALLAINFRIIGGLPRAKAHRSAGSSGAGGDNAVPESDVPLMIHHAAKMFCASRTRYLLVFAWPRRTQGGNLGTRLALPRVAVSVELRCGQSDAINFGGQLDEPDHLAGWSRCYSSLHTWILWAQVSDVRGAWRARRIETSSPNSSFCACGSQGTNVIARCFRCSGAIHDLSKRFSDSMPEFLRSCHDPRVWPLVG